MATKRNHAAISTIDKTIQPKILPKIKIEPNSDSINSSVISNDTTKVIPIFTQEFLNHCKQRSSEIRLISRQISEVFSKILTTVDYLVPEFYFLNERG